MTQVGLVTILFTDLVDSTALLSGLGPDGADELRRAHFQSLRDAVAMHHGREVKNTGDGLMVAFDRPSDGAACAVELQQCTVRLGRRYPAHDIAIRVGLSVGEATNENDDWFGTPSIEAARLCAIADGGQILATEVVRALGAGRGGVQFASLGPRSLKGLPEPVAVVEIAWEPEVAEAELPPLLASLGGPFFVGRDLEAESLSSAWKQSLEHKRRAVLVAGEPGVGKTRLVREVAVTASQGGATILFGRCDEELGLAYQPFVEAIGYYVSTCEREILDRHVAVFGGELTRIVPELAHRVADVPEPLRADPELERHRLFEAVAHLLSLADDGGGVVLILDDLHWADKASLLLLRHLLRTGEPMALLLIGTYRDTDLARTHPLAEMLADFRRQDDVERLMLSGLDVAGVEAFVEAAAGQPLDDDAMSLAHAVHNETEGNPFFVGQVLRHLTETGAIFQRDGQWTFNGDVAHLGIPEGVREVIGRRLTRLADAVNRILRTAAVIGREFDLRLVAQVDDLSEDDVVEALEAAVEARLVAEVPSKPDHFMFAHALVRESLYDELSTSRRTRLHKRIGEALERQAQPPLAALAHHFCEAAAMGDVDKASDYARRAGEEALAAVAYEDAARHFTQGIEVLDEAGVGPTLTRVELLIGLAAARDRGGEMQPAREAAETATALARALDDPDLFARSVLATAVGMPPRLNERGAGLAEEALDRLGPGDSTVRCLLMSSLVWAGLVLDAPVRRLALSTDALAMARRIGDEEALILALSSHHGANWGPANVEERLELANEMVAIEIRSTTTKFSGGHALRLFDLFELGDIDGTRAALDEVERDAVRTRAPGTAVWVQIWRTALDLFTGQLETAEAGLMQWFADHRGIDDAAALASFGVQFFGLRQNQGRCEDVEPAIRELIDQHPTVPGWRCGLAVLLAELDKREELEELLDGLAAQNFEDIEQDAQYTVNFALLAVACAYLGDAERARLVYDALLPYAGRNIVVGGGQASIGASSRYLGMLASTMELWDEAEQHFESALEMNARMGARPWLALTAYEYARMLKISGRNGRAAELLAQASGLADDIGMPLLATRVAALGPQG